MTEMSESETGLYPYTYAYLGKLSTLLWAPSGAGDIFLRDCDGALCSAGNIEDAKVLFGKLPNSISWDEVAFVDFDSFWREIDRLNENTSADEDACAVILAGWNFIEDVLRTYSFNDLRDELNEVQVNKAYKKIFYGSNIDAVTPEGSSYNPEWDKAELEILKSSLRRVWKEIGARTNLPWTD